MDPSERRMTSERCASLIAVAIANRLDEVWVSPHPELLYLYLFQYFPSIAKRLVQKKKIGEVNYLWLMLFYLLHTVHIK